MTVRTERDEEAEPGLTERRPRVWVSAVLWVAMVPFGLWAALRWSGWEPGFRWVQLVAFTPYAAAIAPVVPLAALLLRRWQVLGVGVLVAGLLAGAVVPRAVPDGNPVAGGPALRVLTANLAIGAVPPGDVVGLVRRERIDVLALQEATPALLAALDEAGLRPLLPHRVLHPAPGGAGSAVFAWFPLCAQPVISVGFAQARTLVEVPDAPPVEVVSVHPCAPVRPFLVPCWRAGLRALPRADVRGAVRVLAGDFNATLDHAALRRLTDSGYRDAADVTGDGLHGTWPVGWPTPLPRVALDHVLVDPRVVVRHTETHGLARSDHRALRADLVLPTR